MKKPDAHGSLLAGGLLAAGTLGCPSGPCVFCAAPGLLLIGHGLLQKARHRFLG